MYTYSKEILEKILRHTRFHALKNVLPISLH